MKKFALAFLICSASAFATSVTYSTSAVFSGPDYSTSVPPCPAGSSNCLANGSATIIFKPEATTSVSSPTNISLGDITVAGGSGTFSGDSIVLTITQTVPLPGGSASSSSSVSGSITSTSDGIDLTFTPTHFSIGGVAYIIQNNYFLVAPNTNAGDTSLQASVGSPEPVTLGLVGASLLGLGVMARVRRRVQK